MKTAYHPRYESYTLAQRKHRRAVAEVGIGLVIWLLVCSMAIYACYASLGAYLEM